MEADGGRRSDTFGISIRYDLPNGLLVHQLPALDAVYFIVTNDAKYGDSFTWQYCVESPLLSNGHEHQTPTHTHTHTQT